MPNIITESSIEQVALDILSELKYKLLYGPDIACDGPNPERKSYSDVILIDRLREAIEKINPKIPPDVKEEAIRKILYVKDSINNNIQPPRTVIKHLQAIDSKTDDIMQVTDLIIGAINNKVTSNRHPLKQAVRQAAEIEFGKKIRYWDWSFTK